MAIKNQPQHKTVKQNYCHLRQVFFTILHDDKIIKNQPFLGHAVDENSV